MAVRKLETEVGGGDAEVSSSSRALPGRGSSSSAGWSWRLSPSALAHLRLIICDLPTFKDQLEPPVFTFSSNSPTSPRKAEPSSLPAILPAILDIPDHYNYTPTPFPGFNCCTLQDRPGESQIAGETFILKDFLISRELDFLFVTQTWLNIADPAAAAMRPRTTPPVMKRMSEGFSAQEKTKIMLSYELQISYKDGRLGDTDELQLSHGGLLLTRLVEPNQQP
ncbi:uncharacterized protein LOC115788181 [Archocentrus centrarchus]|uniref:uncharacterized protein LOC115788181 n=1 Tax=Archocentrus centrarchus TaxID=63155 RepID=UPI0011EA4DF7|nr:uncharacterized protein LOC115788181 [Archocentrus centrarchus]